MADAHAEIDLEVKRAAVRPKIEDVVAGKDSEEEFEAGSDRQPVVPRSVPTGAGRAEKKLADRLQELLPRYTVDYEMMVGTTSVDIILRSGTRLDRDYLLELKFIRKGFNAGWLKQVALTLRSAALVYQQAVGRRPNTCVVVGVDDVAWDSQKYADVRRRVLDALPQSTGKHHIAIMSLSELELLDARVARTQLGLPV